MGLRSTGDQLSPDSVVCQNASDKVQAERAQRDIKVVALYTFMLLTLSAVLVAHLASVVAFTLTEYFVEEAREGEGVLLLRALAIVSCGSVGRSSA